MVCILVFMTIGGALNATDVTHIRFEFPGNILVSVIPSDSSEVSIERNDFITSRGSCTFRSDITRNLDSSAVLQEIYMLSGENCRVLIGSRYGSVVVIGGLKTYCVDSELDSD